ncbi:hypothetical protein BH24CHL9_BH24CHL9_00690 [soil metagenome]
MSPPSEVQRSSVRYPGGLSARYRWAGNDVAEQVFALSETGGALSDHGALVSAEPDRLCRAELRVEGPVGTWTARFASLVFDEPLGLLWDTPALLVVKYGFAAYGLASRSGELRWWHPSGTPILAVLGSPRLPHVLVQSEVETIALDASGEVAWRVAHSDVVTGAELMGSTLALTSYAGVVSALDPLTGQTLRA